MGKKNKKKQDKRQPIPAVDYIVYTDGGCAFNPGGPGGCATVITESKTGKKTELNRAYTSTTNNRMEMMAVILALESLPEKATLRLYSDSQYVIKTLQGEYRKKKNVDLWKRIEKAMKGKAVELRWVRGHNGVKENERCDELCTEAMNYMEREVDYGYQNTGSVKETGNLSGGAMAQEIVLDFPYTEEHFMPCTKEEYMQKYLVHDVCATSILDFYTAKKPSFKDYMSLKTGGVDNWSRKSAVFIEDMLIEYGMTENDIRTLRKSIEKYIPLENDQLYCLRWYMRGLPLRDCIRKTLVNAEVAQNCR